MVEGDYTQNRVVGELVMLQLLHRGSKIRGLNHTRDLVVS
jgi:hypothetical protein